MSMFLSSLRTNAILLLWCSYMSLAHLSESNGTDRLALLAFKAHITNDPFHVVSSWNDSVPYCKWLGIVCGGRRHPNRVRVLNLQSSGLVGSLAPEIGNLSFLRDISLQNNSFYGEIPQEVSFLLRLRYLFLYNNSFEGEIPPNISHCSNLIELSFGRNKIVGKIPIELGSFSKLRLLSFHENRLTGQIPPSFGNLSSLDTLSAGYNSFSGSIPNAFGQLTRLYILALGGNKLSDTFPPSIYNISSLGVLDVYDNQLQGNLPPNLGFNLPNLFGFQIAANQFHGSLPASISNLSNLKQINVERNNLTGKVAIHFGGLSRLNWLSLADNHLGSGEAGDDLGFINTLTNCSSLAKLWLGANQFGGVLPNSIANLSIQLRDLTMPLNQISGKIPVHMENLVSLQRLTLSYNLLEGIIPTSIGGLQMLNELDLVGNGFTGQIPSSLGSLTRLIDLHLDGNRLHGKIPSSLQNCKNLLRLGLSGNSFNGVIPKEIFDISQLIELDLSRNYFISSLPLEVGQLTNLETLAVSENMLSGEIPSTLGVCTSLVNLVMESNLFQGSIPLSLSSLRGLQDLDLSNNNLSGPIPKYMETFKYVQNLNLSFNHLEGEVPVGGVFGNFSAVSVIGNNKLCGGSLGCVYKGTLNHGETIVAVKVFKIEQRGASKSFMAECEALRNIRHRNLVKILTSCSSIDFEGNNFKALVYEFMPGGNLEEWLHPQKNGVLDEQRHLNFVQRLNIAIDIASVLDYLHHHCHMQIIHCDIKPSNILLDDDLTAHLGDLGISRILSKATYRSQHHTSSIGIKGSIGYIAPEYGAGATVSTHGDVYSYGILLLEMFTGKRPTNEIFKDNFNLHNWAEMALQDGVMAVLDPSLLPMEEDEEMSTEIVAKFTGSRRRMKDKMLDCLNSIIRIGVACSAESPCDRMHINDVVKELLQIRNVILKSAFTGENDQ
ncbi:probable LRR receptor-like serine/threonine-protein kinase At3g47570 [Macadamia integrifolia]|uniref:probable LRR receptor-like serine/threonine-protein kinase At3g47570 n=1 Tax=Macadamia integrifolia TaxID=60698 RepID=UPI001C501E12|nr:probable LRR receptor-like serine/threonine-protein kinase At3g47570 [Macadamia integrifolia]